MYGLRVSGASRRGSGRPASVANPRTGEDVEIPGLNAEPSPEPRRQSARPNHFSTPNMTAPGVFGFVPGAIRNAPVNSPVSLNSKCAFS